MLLNNLLLIIVLLMVVSLFSMLSEKLRISYPIFLVICGLFIGFIPKILDITLEPDLVFLIFLPPLLYSAAWNTSWKDFWALRTPIGLLALGLVIFTSCAVAIVAHLLIPGFSLALGFLLGGIISPPDAIAATSVLEKLRIPKRVVDILEGESLVNDAASLIVFRFALAAVVTHKFVLLEAGFDFIIVVVAGILVGLGIAIFIYAFHRFLPTTPSIDTAITLIAPYFMYVTAEHFHFSGVLAVVSGGLFLSARSTEVFFIQLPNTIAGSMGYFGLFAQWGSFIMIGLQLPVILKHLDPAPINHAIFYGVTISIVTILVRIIWVFPAAYLPRLLSKKIRTNEAVPDWKPVFIIAWSGMRGVVSLAAALSIPLTLSSGAAFPQRDLILFISFIVILCTLVLQGLSLPFLVHAFDLEIKDDKTEQELEIQMHLVSSVLAYIKTRYSEEIETDHAFGVLKRRYEHLLNTQQKQLSVEEDMPSYIFAYRAALLELIEVRRKALDEMNTAKKYPSELIRNIEKRIDHEEASLSIALEK